MIAVVTRSPRGALLRLMEHAGITFEVVPPGATAERLARHDALAILADDYPRLPPNVGMLQALVASFLASNKPVYCEFLPLPGLFTAGITTKAYTRLVARPCGSGILDGLDPLALLEAHQNPFLVAEATLPADATELLSFARVAGVHAAIYGLPGVTYPGLVQRGRLLASSTKLSDFDAMEFRPKARFGRLAMNACKFLCEGWHPVDMNAWTNPHDNRGYMASMKGDDVPARKRRCTRALAKGLDWFERAGMFPEPLGVGGVYEGFTSAFDPGGKKAYRFFPELGFKVQRGDCTADSATAFFLASRLPASDALGADAISRYRATGENLFHELHTYWQKYPDDRSIMRGFFGWANTPYDINVAYSDDNGRVVMESLLHAHVTQDRDLLTRAFAGVNALRSTVGKNGHRWARIDLKHFHQKKGRKWFATHDARRHQYHSPHYDTWTLAALLYGAWMIGERPIIDLAWKGMRDYMNKFPDIHLEHSAGDDFSKLLVAAVMLYQATKRDDHLQYVQRIVDFFEPYQDEQSGAFPEIDPYHKHARTEPKNEKYGTGESALYTSPGDTISDQLYSLGFLAMGLYFATRTGRVPKARAMLDRLLDYLCAIQLASGNPQLDGAWTRGFDYRLGEPYGANGDVGWGAYSIETGWTIGPILTTLAMDLLDLDPFAPLDPAVQARARADYLEEKGIQDGLERTWQAHTPRPIKHFTSMSPGEIAASLKGFKCNSVDRR